MTKLTKRYKHALLTIVVCTTFLISSVAYAQIAERMVPIIMYLLDEIDNRLKAIPKNRLNDTGITNGLNANATLFNTTCSSDIAFDSPQDCNYGTDIIPDTDADGYAGFSFTFVDDNGELQQPQDKDSACAVLDNVTGLMWDSGKPESGLKAPDATYQWFAEGPLFNFLESKGNSDTCPGFNSSSAATLCNTDAYIKRLNAAQWCGHNDWRLPTDKELLGILTLYDGTARNFLSENHFGEMPTVWSSTLFLFDGFLEQTSEFFLSTAHVSRKNNDFSGQPIAADTSHSYNSILAVRHD